MTFSDIKGLRVLSIADGKDWGEVDALFIDKASRETVYIGCTEGLFSPQEINGIGDVVALLSTPLQGVATSDYVVLRRDAPIYDCKGMLLAKEWDYPISASYKNQRLLSVANESYDIDKIAYSGEVIFVNTGRQLPAKRSIVKNNDVPLACASIPRDNKQEYSFLLGRTTKRSILDINGNVIIKLGTVITASIIELAKKHGKLVELVTISRS